MTMEERLIGTISRGVRAPIIREGDDLAKIVVDSVIDAAASSRYGFEIQDKDIVAVTEAVVARAQGNYASIDNIAADVKEKFGDEAVGVIFPILSRNRFAICLKGIARGVKKVVLMLSYPSDEVGNHLIDEDELDAKGVNPWADVLSEEKYRELFGYKKHTFTGVDYIEYYKDVIKEQGAEVEVVLANDCRTILKYTDNVICCDIHTRARSKRRLLAAGAKKVYCLDDIMTATIDGSGYNEKYGLLGSNKATEETIKLFPRDCQPFVDRVHQMIIDDMISTGHARALLAIEDEEQQYMLANKIFDEKLSVRETEKLVKALKNPKKEEKKPEVENQFVYTNLEEQMKSLIGTKVSVHAKANGKGKIEIEYYSPDDLERIYELLMTIQHN